MIQGVGTDIVSVARIDGLMNTEGSRFLARWFKPEEIAYCSSKAHPARHYAARLAAKESVAKALRLDSDGPVPWLNIEIALDDRGAPLVRLAAIIRESMPQPDVSICVSMSHCDEFATAVAVLETATVIEDGAASTTPGAETGLGARAATAGQDKVAQALHEYDALRDPDADPELEAVKAAVVLEDLTGVVLSDADIDPTLLADANSMLALIRRLRGPA